MVKSFMRWHGEPIDTKVTQALPEYVEEGDIDKLIGGRSQRPLANILPLSHLHFQRVATPAVNSHDINAIITLHTSLAHHYNTLGLWSVRIVYVAKSLRVLSLRCWFSVFYLIVLRCNLLTLYPHTVIIDTGVMPMYSTKEAAEKLGLSQDHIRYLARKGIIRAKKLGRDWVVLDLNYTRKRKPKKGVRNEAKIIEATSTRTWGFS